jgi:hypothetical protein
MDKQDYVNALKGINMRPNKIKVQPRNEEVLKEFGDEKLLKDIKLDHLQELFIGLQDVEKIAKGPSRDAQLLRLGVIAEQDAANLYEAMAVLADDQTVKDTLLDITYEEKVHAGEFSALLQKLDPEFSPSEDEGEDEVDEMEED